MTINAKIAAKIRRNIKNLNISLVTSKNDLDNLNKFLSTTVNVSPSANYPLHKLGATWGNWNATVGTLAKYFAKLADMVDPDTPVVFNTNADRGCTIKYARYGYAGYFHNVIVSDNTDPSALIKEMVDASHEAKDEEYDTYNINFVKNSVFPVIYLTVYGKMD